MKYTENSINEWQKYLDEETDPESIDLSGFETKKELSPDVWEDEDFIKTDLKKNLEKIARDFLDSLGITAEIKDIIVTGSLANYNWSQFSDVDLHILLDFGEIDENTELVKQMFDKSRIMWNKDHDIKVKDHDIEIYVQDINEPHVSTGIYSILDDKWEKKPIPTQISIEKDDIRKKSAHLMDEIDETQNMLDEGDDEGAFLNSMRLKEKIKNFRKGGLEKGGEFSSENLSFKVLRRNGYLEKLGDIYTSSYDSIMSIDEKQEEIGEQTEPYQIKAKKRFNKMLRITVKGNNKYKVKGMKTINPKVGKSAPAIEE